MVRINILIEFELRSRLGSWRLDDENCAIRRCTQDEAALFRRRHVQGHSYESEQESKKKLNVICIPRGSFESIFLGMQQGYDSPPTAYTSPELVRTTNFMRRRRPGT